VHTKLLLVALLCTSAWADEGRVADPVRTKAITVDLNSCPKPVWPQESLRREETGRVTLAFLIGLDGTVLESKVVTSSGHPLLDYAARDGLEKCKFTPPSQVGRTQPEWMKMQYVWTLEGALSPEQQAARRARVLAEAEQGDAEAQFKAAGVLLASEPKDPAKAVEFLRLAAEQGHVRAQLALAYQLTMSKDGPDLAGAETWLRRAAEKNSAEAQLALGQFLQMQGRDPAEAREWLRKSAAQGSPAGQAMYAAILMRDDAGVAEAIPLLEQAAEKQNRYAQFQLGQCYAEGRGVERDKEKAQRLFERAAAAGFPPATRALLALKSAP